MKFSPIGLFRRFLKFTNFSSQSSNLDDSLGVVDEKCQDTTPFTSSQNKGLGFFFCLAAGRSPVIIPKSLFFAVVCLLALPSMVSASCVKGNCTNGKGVYVTKDGNKYIGKFRDGQINGEGRWVSRHGDSYRGSFVNGKSEGKGKLSLANGESYIGDFVNGKFHGKGKYSFKNGDDYIGQWQYGKMHGVGTYYFSNGTHKKGEYIDGKLIVRHQEPELVQSTSNTFNEGEVVSLDEVTKDCTQLE